MKQVIMCIAVCLLISISHVAHAGIFGGGISGPMPVYNVDKSVDAATLATQINTAQQLQAALANLAKMDATTAAENQQLIYSNLQQLAQLQQQMQSLVMDYSEFQNSWNNMYPEFQSDYANQANQIVSATDQAVYEAMLMQGMGVAGISNSSANLQGLLNASQTAQGALAAAQAGNQIAAIQAQQFMQLQQMIAQSNNAQLAYQKQKMEQDRAAEQAAAQAYYSDIDSEKGRGTGVIR